MNYDIRPYIETGKKNILLIYICYAGGLLIPILPIIGAAFAYVYRNCQHYIWQSHYLFALRTFCFGIIGLIMSIVMPVIFIGPILYMLVSVLCIVRSIIALQYLRSNLPHPRPLSFWIQ